MSYPLQTELASPFIPQSPAQLFHPNTRRPLHHPDLPTRNRRVSQVRKPPWSVPNHEGSLPTSLPDNQIRHQSFQALVQLPVIEIIIIAAVLDQQGQIEPDLPKRLPDRAGVERAGLERILRVPAVMVQTFFRDAQGEVEEGLQINGVDAVADDAEAETEDGVRVGDAEAVSEERRSCQGTIERFRDVEGRERGSCGERIWRRVEVKLPSWGCVGEVDKVEESNS